MAGVKLVYIASIWTIVTLTIPLLIAQEDWNEYTWILHIERLFFIVAITVPFDIRDAKTDSSDMLTLPMWIGVKKAKYAALILMTFCISFHLIFNYDMSFFLPVMITYTTAILLIYFSDKPHGDMYFSFGLEGIPILLIATALLEVFADSLFSA